MQFCSSEMSGMKDKIEGSQMLLDTKLGTGGKGVNEAQTEPRNWVMKAQDMIGHYGLLHIKELPTSRAHAFYIASLGIQQSMKTLGVQNTYLFLSVSLCVSLCVSLSLSLYT
jgi:hypothetical protein